MKKDWGPPMWKTIHYVAVSYPEEPTQEDKENYANFYTNISNVIPCKPCRVHFKKMLSDYPLTEEILQNQENLFSWTVFLHNKVNLRLGKKIITLEEAKELYYKHKNNKRRYIIILILILITIYIIKKCR